MLSHVLLSILAYSICSSALLLLNKLLLQSFPFPVLVIAIQLSVVAVVVYVLSLFSLVKLDAINWGHAKKYTLYSFGFAFGLFSNMKALQESNVNTVIVFRAMLPLLVVVPETLLLQKPIPSLRSIIALLLISVGSYGYVSINTQLGQQETGEGAVIEYNLSSYVWPFLYVSTMVFQMIYGKQLISTMGSFSLASSVVYSNLFSAPLVSVLLLTTDEHNTLGAFAQEVAEGTVATIAVTLLSTIVAAVGIGFSSWWCRSLISATEYSVVGVVNKSVCVLLSAIIWPESSSLLSICFIFLSLAGGFWYQFSAAAVPTTRRSQRSDSFKSKLSPLTAVRLVNLSKEVSGEASTELRRPGSPLHRKTGSIDGGQ